MPPFRRFSKSEPGTPETFEGKHRFEHWDCDNQVYFITARCRDRFPDPVTPTARCAAQSSSALEGVPYKRYDNH